MKNQILLLTLCVTACFCNGSDINREFSKTDQQIDEFYGTAAAERGAARQHATLISYMESISNTSKMPVDVAIPKLGKMLQKLCRGNIFQVPERVAVYDTAMEALLSIPGHARYFADEIEMEREKIKDLPPKDPRRGVYNLKRSENLKSILVHLKSPETITVLGNYLYDERDPTPPPSPAQDWTSIPPNSEIAAEALEQIGLRNYPYREKNDFGNANAVSKNRAWWEEVKSGKKAFSFKGQKVEYRFKPDGTWDTIALINPPDDAPQTQKAQDPRGKNQTSPATVKVASGRPAYSWLWIVGGVIAMLVTAVGFFLRRHKGGK